MKAPAPAKPALHTTAIDDSDPIVAELRLRCILRTDGERVANRLEELLAAWDADPIEANRLGLQRAATHLRVTGARRHSLRTIVRSLQTLAGDPVVLACPSCDQWVVAQLCGKVTCGPCGQRLALKSRRDSDTV
jgi:hypothetical protein